MSAAIYDEALADPGPLLARDGGGRIFRVPVERWLAPADAVDRALLADVTGPVLDLGCGPGRHLRLALELGHQGLGVDRSAVAVGLVRQSGLPALAADVLDTPPAPGTWGSVLLLDGNIGIGGRPAALLRRVAEALRPDGRAIVEVAAPGSGVRHWPLRLERGDAVGRWFDWTTVGAEAIGALAAPAGLGVCDRRVLGGRWFVTLEHTR